MTVNNITLKVIQILAVRVICGIAVSGFVKLRDQYWKMNTYLIPNKHIQFSLMFSNLNSNGRKIQIMRNYS